MGGDHHVLQVKVYCMENKVYLLGIHKARIHSPHWCFPDGNGCLLRLVYFSVFETKIRCQLFQKSPIRLPRVIIELMRCFL